VGERSVADTVSWYTLKTTVTVRRAPTRRRHRSGPATPAQPVWRADNDDGRVAAGRLAAWFRAHRQRGRRRDLRRDRAEELRLAVDEVATRTDHARSAPAGPVGQEQHSKLLIDPSRRQTLLNLTLRLRSQQVRSVPTLSSINRLRWLELGRLFSRAVDLATRVSLARSSGRLNDDQLDRPVVGIHDRLPHRDAVGQWWRGRLAAGLCVRAVLFAATAVCCGSSARPNDTPWPSTPRRRPSALS
jgi:hypothetical protein